MWRSKLFRRFFIVFAILGVIASTILISYFNRTLEQLVTQQVQQRLKDVADMAAFDARRVLLNHSEIDSHTQWHTLGQSLDVRVRIFDAERVLLVDTSGLDENAPELKTAIKDLLEIEGWAITSSAEPEDEEILYKLKISENKKNLGLILTSLPRAQYEGEIAAKQRVVTTLVLATFTLSMVLITLLTSRIVSALEILRQGANSLASGNFQPDINIETNDELESVADSFNSMSHQLKSRLNLMSQQKRKSVEGTERLRTVLGAMIEGVIAVDEQEHILFANRAAVNIFEITNRDYTNRPLVEAIRHPGVLDVVHEVLNNRRLLTVEIEIPRKDIILSVIASRLPGDPAGGVVMVFHDTTELRRLENLRREFVSNVSHELKTPLAAIQAYTDTLLEGGLEDPSINRKFLQRIEEQADRLHMLIIDVIKIAQVESGQEMFEMLAIKIDEMVDECVQDHQAVAESKKIDIRVQPPDSQDISVHADLDGLRTIIDNLLDNALKYTLDHGTVTISWRADEKHVWLSISDTGVGISQEHLSRIFERFYRADKARSREMGGTGLGLSIVKHLSQVFGGSINVESVQGEGTTFTLELPRA